MFACPGRPANWLLLKFWNGLLIGYLLGGFGTRKIVRNDFSKGFYALRHSEYKHITPCRLAAAWVSLPCPDHAGCLKKTE